jgi:hexosaminidase
MVSLFPDEYVHIGGDEVVAKQWEENPKIQKFMKKHNLKDYRELQNDFNLKVQKILNKYGKKMVGWDEILHPSLVKNSVIQSWRGRDVLVAAAKQGYKTILSNGYYIDLIYPAEAHYLNDPLTPDMGLTESEAENILGGEATMWSEFVTPETVDSRVWPRTAAIAERLWSAASVCDVDDMVRRLEAFSLRLEEQGLTHEKNYEMMLRRLAAGPNIEPLKTLVDVVEPVKEYKRSGQKQYTSFSPMTRVVDAARPDSRVARKFNKRVDELLGGCTPDSVVPLLKADLSRWRENHPLLLPLIRRSPILREIETLSSDLSVCAEIGLEALGQKETGRIWTADWILERKTKIDSAQQPRGQVELVVLDGIRKLLEWK